jgi:antagonist of KipI
LKIEKWLNSASTNLKAGAGGFKGRSLQKEDVIEFKNEKDYSSLLKGNSFFVMPWKAGTVWHEFENNSFYVLPGSEWGWLDENSRSLFLNEPFKINVLSDRMGYKLNGPELSKIKDEELVSSAVGFGTIQLLPDGQLTILMADHQTTGGYPRIANVITAHLSRLSQTGPEEKITFRMTDIITAEALLVKQDQHLKQLENACNLRLQEFLKSR